MSADDADDAQPTFTREELRVLKQIASLSEEEREQLQNVLNPNRTTRRALLKGATGLGALSLLGVGATETGAAASGTYGNGNQNWNVNKLTAAQSDLGKLVGDINGNGHAITGLSSLDTDELINTGNVSGFDYTIFLDGSGTLYSVDKNGKIVWGGPENVGGLSDTTDFGEVLQKTVNNSSNQSPAIRLGTYGVPVIKSTANCTDMFRLYGPGKNRVIIEASSGMDNNVAIDVSPSSQKYIMRIDSVKFGSSSSAGKPSRWLQTSNVGEILVTNCEFRDAQGYGLHVTGSNGWDYFQNCWFTNAGSGFYIENTMNANPVHVTNCVIKGDSEISGYDNAILEGCYVDPTTTITRTNVGNYRALGNINERSTSTDIPEDANSPLTISGATTGTLNFADNYDHVLLVFENAGSAQGNNVSLRFDGDSTVGYSWTTNADTQTTGQTYINLNRTDDLVPGTNVGVQTSAPTGSSIYPVSVTGGGRGTGLTTHGAYTGGPSGGNLSSVTVFNPGGLNIDAKVHVYGR